MSDVTDRELEELDMAECLRLISPGGIGRIAYSGRYGPAVYPVNYRLYEGVIVFRTTPGSPTDSDLRTGIPGADYRVAFEIDAFDSDAREVCSRNDDKDQERREWQEAHSARREQARDHSCHGERPLAAA